MCGSLAAFNPSHNLSDRGTTPHLAGVREYSRRRPTSHAADSRAQPSRKALERAELGPVITEPRACLAQCCEIPPADLDIPILGQLALAQLPLGDALEPGALSVLGFYTPLGSSGSGGSRWNRCRGTLTTPRYRRPRPRRRARRSQRSRRPVQARPDPRRWLILLP